MPCISDDALHVSGVLPRSTCLAEQACNSHKSDFSVNVHHFIAVTEFG